MSAIFEDGFFPPLMVFSLSETLVSYPGIIKIVIFYCLTLARVLTRWESFLLLHEKHVFIRLGDRYSNKPLKQGIQAERKLNIHISDSVNVRQRQFPLIEESSGRQILLKAFDLLSYLPFFSLRPYNFKNLLFFPPFFFCFQEFTPMPERSLFLFSNIHIFLHASYIYLFYL